MFNQPPWNEIQSHLFQREQKKENLRNVRASHASEGMLMTG